MKKKGFRVIAVLALCLALLTAAALAAEEHTCAEGEWEDHMCDQCGEPLNDLCTDPDGDHFCNLCWLPVTAACVDADGDEYCDVCFGHMAEYCADGDNNHSCDACWRVLSTCLDEDKNHLCDICGGVFWVDENADGICDGCEAVLTHVSAKHIGVYYHAGKDGTVVADMAIEVTVEPYVADVGAPAGTVAVRWSDEDGKTYTTAEKALTFGQTTATVEFPSLPLEAINRGRVTFTPYDAGFTPAENGCVAEHDMPTLWIDSDSECTVNGVTANKLFLLSGTKVTVELQPGQTENWEWVFEEGYAVPEVSVDGRTTTFLMPEESVNMHAAWRCKICTDADGDNWCDVCEYYVEDPIYVGGVELADGYYLSNDGTVCAAKPEGGYAHFKSGTLTLNAYEYAGTGYHFAGNYATSGEPYEEYILIYADDALTIHVEADSALVNTAEVGENVYSVGIYADELYLTGDSLTLSAGGEAIRCETAHLENAVLDVIAEVGIYSDASGIYEENEEFYGDAVRITDSDVTLIGVDGIYAYVGDISVNGSTLTITAEASGIYAYDNGVYLDSSAVTILAGDEAVFAYTGLELDENYPLLLPEGGTVAEKTGTTKGGEEYTYYTIVDGAGEVAASVKIGKPCPAADYADVKTDIWYHDAVDYVIENDLMNEVSETSFAPQGEADRATFVYALWKAAGAPVVNYLMMYEDVNQEEWYAEAVCWASAMGIAKGYPDGTFRPAETITRQQMATFLYRYEQHKGGGFTGMWMFLLDCTDRSDVAEWAYEPLCWLTMKGVMQGDGTGALKPQATATRAEVAQLIKNYMELDI